LDLPLDGRLKRPTGTIAEDVIDDRHGCQSQLKYVSFHEAYPFCPMWDMVNRFVTIHRRYAAFIQTPAIHDFRLYLDVGAITLLWWQSFGCFRLPVGRDMADLQGELILEFQN
jgi:hypothetical protein